MNLDTAYVESDEDTHEDRTYRVATACPCRDNCSAGSWGRVDKYSYLNEKIVRGFIRDHLVGSSLHQMSQEDAEAYASFVDNLTNNVLMHFSLSTVQNQAIHICIRDRSINIKDLFNMLGVLRLRRCLR